MARIRTIYGPMFSGKTREILKLHAEFSSKKLVFKHALDSRTRETLSSHDPEVSDKVPAIPINSLYQILEYIEHDTKIVFVDEAQFFDLTQTVTFLSKMGSKDILFIFSGLDLNWKGEPFETMSYLIQKADDRNWMLGKCAQCGDAASHSYFKHHASNDSIKVIGGSEAYEPRCQSCFTLGMETCATTA